MSPATNTPFPTDLVRAAQLKDHLSLLRAFDDLKARVVDADAIPGVDEEAKWAYAVGLAVERFEKWAVALDVGEKELVDVLPPIDVLLVWHAYLLNPGRYAEDTSRVDALKNLPRLGRVFGAAFGHDLGAILAAEPSQQRKDAWLNLTQTPFDLLEAAAEMTQKSVACPKCRAAVLAPYATPSDTGYLQPGFELTCTCGFVIQHETLALRRFAEDLAAEDVLLAGTLPQDPVRALAIKAAILRAYKLEDASADSIMRSFDYDAKRALAIKETQVDNGVIERITSAYSTDKPFSLDVVGAVLRQGSFIDKMVALGWTQAGFAGAELDTAVVRYHGFLTLLALSPGTLLVPTLDVDLAWHTHQLMADQYANDTRTWVGRFIDHDDTIPAADLAASLETTARVWEARFGVPYTHAQGDTAKAKGISVGDYSRPSLVAFLVCPTMTMVRFGVYAFAFGWTAVTLGAATNIHKVCEQISASTSNSTRVSFPGSTSFIEDTQRWINTTVEASVCSVEPAGVEDVAEILKIVGDARTPFAVKGAGHAYNRGFSSTPGVQIALAPGLTEVVYDAGSATVEVGAGCLWDDVYAVLEPFNVSVVGGRSGGVGVAGLLLGGGYSWLSSQYGLAFDNIVSYELVLPNGTIVIVDEETEPELSFALKGGWNNFGIVTKFVLKTFPQGQIWGGPASYSAADGDALIAAAAAFSANVTDPKAAMIFGFASRNGSLSASVQLFYDAPSPPPGMFDAFLALTPVSGGFTTHSYLSIVKATAAPLLPNGVGGTFSLINITEPILRSMRNLTQTLSPAGAELSLSFGVESFQPDLLTRSNGVRSAYPASRSLPLQPVSLFSLSLGAATEDTMQTTMREYSRAGKDAAIQQGQTALAGADASVYGNYAQGGTPVEMIWGTRNAEKLGRIKRWVDPEGVMDLAGGWKVPAL
ncbi:FAD dependent oxidoreductase [Mycena kentingensis (nom. inval.)]|nr:FAD dependent oxidoreductase [Mycena kentingensis (nom. inval.)]